jgi:hypothetical protein
MNPKHFHNTEPRKCCTRDQAWAWVAALAAAALEDPSERHRADAKRSLPYAINHALQVQR